MNITDIVIAKKLAGGSGGGGGSSDFSTAEVTIDGIITDPANVYTMPFVDPDYVEDGCVGDYVYAREDPYTLLVPLYQGKCSIFVGEDIVNSGNALYDADNSIVTITGDCSLKAKGD